MTGRTLDEVRPFLGDFERKRYTNPSLMWAILKALGVRWWKTPQEWPRHGLARIQWHGPWTEPGVPIGARYRHTHWVGACWGASDGAIGIFDVNALANGFGWCSLKDWSAVIVPWILKECEPRANGSWSITHAVEIAN